MLIESAKTGDDEMVKIILENEEVDVNIEDDYGYTALCYAALKGNKWDIHKRQDKFLQFLTPIINQFYLSTFLVPF